MYMRVCVIEFAWVHIDVVSWHPVQTKTSLITDIATFFCLFCFLFIISRKVIPGRDFARLICLQHNMLLPLELINVPCV